MDNVKLNVRLGGYYIVPAETRKRILDGDSTLTLDMVRSLTLHVRDELLVPDGDGKCQCVEIKPEDNIELKYKSK